MSPRAVLRAASVVWPILGLALLTLALTWPVARFLGTHVVDRQDPLLNAWIMSWEAYQLLRDPLRLFQANIFYPYPYSLAFSEILLSTTALVLPVRWAGANPIATHNLAFLLAFFTTALGGYLFALYLTGHRLAAVVAGVAYAFSPYRAGHFSQVQLLAFGWLPLAMLALDRLLSGRGPLRRNATLFGLFFLLQALASFYSAVFAATACALYAAGLGIARLSGRPPADAPAGIPNAKARVAALAVATALVGLVMVPFARPYFQARRDLGAGWTLAENETFSASLQAYAYAPAESRVWGPLTAGLAYTYGPCCPPDTLFPGLTLVTLAAVAIVRGRGWRRWLLVALLLAGFCLSLGPALQLAPGQPTAIRLPYGWLFAHVPGLSALRAPVRWAVLVTLGLGLLAAWGLAHLRRPLAAWIALGLVLLEFSVVPLRLVPAPEPPPVAGWLAQRPPTRIVELPLAAELPTEPVPADQPRRAWEVSRLLEHQIASTRHWHTTPDGYSGYIPASHGDFAREMRAFPSERTLALLQGLRVEYVVLHSADLPPARREWIARRLPDFPALEVAAEVDGATVLRVAPGEPTLALEWMVFAPQTVAPGQPFDLWLVARIEGVAGVPPSLRYTARAAWDGDPSHRSAAGSPVRLPAVIDRVAVAGLALVAPETAGSHRLSVTLDQELAGRVESLTNGPPPRVSLDVEVVVAENPPTSATRPVAVVLDRIELPERAAAGGSLPVLLQWRALQPLDHYASLSLRLVAPDGETVAQRDGPPGGEVGTLLWQPGEPYGSTWLLDVPAEAAPGVYRIEVLWYDPSSGRRSALWADDRWVETVTAGSVAIERPSGERTPAGSARAE